VRSEVATRRFRMANRWRFPYTLSGPGASPGITTYPAAVTVRRAVNDSRRWFHWQTVQTSTT
jgi:hypothetical protein